MTPSAAAIGAISCSNECASASEKKEDAHEREKGLSAPRLEPSAPHTITNTHTATTEKYIGRHLLAASSMYVCMYVRFCFVFFGARVGREGGGGVEERKSGGRLEAKRPRRVHSQLTHLQSLQLPFNSGRPSSRVHHFKHQLRSSPPFARSLSLQVAQLPRQPSDDGFHLLRPNMRCLASHCNSATAAAAAAWVRSRGTAVAQGRAVGSAL